VHEPRAFAIQMAIEKLKSYKSPGTDKIPVEFIQSGGRTFRVEIHKLINSMWNKEELPEEWKESIIVPNYKKRGKTDCSTMYKILSNILLSRLTPYAEEISGDHQCEFRRNKSTDDHIFCIRRLREEKYENTMKQ
jgi:hypothetical protein